MWEDHRKWDQTLKSGGMVHTETSIERRQVLEVIPKSIEEKIAKYTARKLDISEMSLLVYLNISPQFSVGEIVAWTEVYKDNFQSLWLLCGGNAVRLWPEPQRVLRAQHDPLG
jgi:hypothetical protein